jgi:hypothetical protein
MDAPCPREGSQASKKNAETFAREAPMPQPERVLHTLHQAIRAFRQTPGRSGRLVRLPAGAEILIAGDMHGSVENFRLLLKRAELARQPGRHLVVQELVHGPFRYPAGGDKSHQLLDLIAALKCQFPDRIHYLLGNHELAQWRRQAIGKGDVDQNEVFRAGIENAYGSFAAEIEMAYDELFAAANLAVRTTNRVLLSHSLPSARILPSFEPALLEEENPPPEAWQLGGALHALVWGRDLREDTAAAFLHKLDADWLITGHIPCPEGYQTPNSRQLILDALGTPACCCLFPTDRPLTREELLSGVCVL